MTVDEIDYRFNTKQDIEQDLEISSSESDSSITSTGTMCLDKREEANRWTVTMLNAKPTLNFDNITWFLFTAETQTLSLFLI